MLFYKVTKNTSDEENNECETHRASSGRKNHDCDTTLNSHMNWVITVNCMTFYGVVLYLAALWKCRKFVIIAQLKYSQ